jgi:hypothetical protein
MRDLGSDALGIVEKAGRSALTKIQAHKKDRSRWKAAPAKRKNIASC